MNGLVGKNETSSRTDYLAGMAADTLRYRKVTAAFPSQIKYMGKFEKGRTPAVWSWPNSVTIFQPHYDVTFYMHQDVHLRGGEWIVDGVLINGWPNDDIIDRMLEVWNWPELATKYNDVYTMLKKNPMYRRPLPTAKVSKKIHASQIEI